MNFQNGMSSPFGNLKVLNNEKLNASEKRLSFIDEFIDVIIIPLSGSLVYNDSLSNKTVLGNNQIGIFSVQEGMAYELMNVSGKAQADYIHVWLKSDGKFFTRQNNQRELSISESNCLVSVFENKNSASADIKINADAWGFIGIYDKRKFERYTLKNSNNGLSILVIDGKFRFQDRLMIRNERISINGISHLDFEMISGSGSFLLLEVPL